jgi:selenide,water dikinase
LTNAGAQPDDVLVLTKPLGSGILTTALKKGLLDDATTKKVVEVMATLNRSAAEALDGLRVHALTDITGFGLLGHLAEMAEGSGVSIRLNRAAVPVLGEVRRFAGQGIYPGGATRNRERIEPKVQWAAKISEETKIILTDPQTSGGLLVAIAPDDVDEPLNRLAESGVLAQAVIGGVTGRSDRSIEIVV